MLNRVLFVPCPRSVHRSAASLRTNRLWHPVSIRLCNSRHHTHTRKGSELSASHTLSPGGRDARATTRVRRGRTLSCASIRAPNLRSRSTMPNRPNSAALCNGVSPICARWERRRGPVRCRSAEGERIKACAWKRWGRARGWEGGPGTHAAPHVDGHAVFDQVLGDFGVPVARGFMQRRVTVLRGRRRATRRQNVDGWQGSRGSQRGAKYKSRLAA